MSRGASHDRGAIAATIVSLFPRIAGEGLGVERGAEWETVPVFVMR